MHHHPSSTTHHHRNNNNNNYRRIDRRCKPVSNMHTVPMVQSSPVDHDIFTQVMCLHLRHNNIDRRSSSHRSFSNNNRHCRQNHQVDASTGQQSKIVDYGRYVTYYLLLDTGKRKRDNDDTHSIGNLGHIRIFGYDTRSDSYQQPKQSHRDRVQIWETIGGGTERVMLV